MSDLQQVLPDIPRLYTALAEWLACMTIIIYVKKRVKGVKLWALCGSALVVQSVFLMVTSGQEGVRWILCMAAAISLMIAFLYLTCDVNWMDAAYYTSFAFIVAETAASFEWQLYLYGNHIMDQAPGAYPYVVLFAVYGIMYAAVWRLNTRLFEREAALKIDSRQFLEAAVIAVCVFFISNLGFLTVDTPFSGKYSREIFNIRTFADVAGLAVLCAFHVQWRDLGIRMELESIQAILHNQYTQYQQSQKTLDMINYRYHDLKHHIIALRAEQDMNKRNEYLNKMEAEIINYETQNKTGSKVLDTLLTSKGMDCQQHNISFTCVADGSLLEFMDVMDICSIFGNALDNAIECEKKIKDKEKRMIHVSASSKKNFLIIKIENYYEGTLQFDKDLPVTTKKEREFHGYGLKSLRYTVHKYKGEVDITTADNWFCLKILIPL